MFKPQIKFDLVTKLALLQVIIVTIDLVHNILTQGISAWVNMFWFCFFASYMFLIGAIFNLRWLMSSVLITSVLAQTPWIIDFILSVFGLSQGRSSVIFEYEPIIVVTAILFHILLIPFSYYGCYKRGYSEKSWISAWVIFGIALLAFSWVFLPVHLNINCVYHSCDLDFERDFNEITSDPFNFTIGYLLREILFNTILGFLIFFGFYFHFKQKGLLVKQLEDT